MADRFEITVDPAPRAEDVVTVRNGLMAFNERAAGPAQIRTLAMYVRDEAGVVLGGLVGYLAWAWLSVDLLWVHESLRGQGYGSALLARAEELAREAGCIASRLDTFEFQARPFYERHGYSVYATLEGHPPGSRHHFLTKTL